MENFFVMQMMRRAQEAEQRGESIMHLEVGQPSTSASRAVLRAAERALSTNILGYTGEAGTESLRQKISDHYQHTYGVHVGPERIITTIGASGAILVVFTASFNPGDRVAIASPGYPCYHNILQAVGCDVVTVEVDASTNFQLTAAQLDEADADSSRPIRGVVVASPSNPTGTMLSPPELQELAQWCAQRKATLVSDEIYHNILYGTVEQSTAAAFSSAVVISSFSKYFSMTGWRLGWLVVPPRSAESERWEQAVRALQQNLFISPPTLAQLAVASAAFSLESIDELDGHVHRYSRNRNLLMEALPALGFEDISRADGAFYVWARCDNVAGKEGSGGLCNRVLDHARTAITPGFDFDKRRGNSYVRFSYSGSEATIEEAIQRLHATRARWSA